jgi:hypothetical protein
MEARKALEPALGYLWKTRVLGRLVCASATGSVGQDQGSSGLVFESNGE